jgi:hypothetical protein
MRDNCERCVKCEWFAPKKAPSGYYIGFCYKYGCPIQDAIKGCDKKEVSENGDE